MRRKFSWDGHKAAVNRRKHGISFEVATQVFNDPFAVSFHERIENGERRWQTIGYAGGTLLMLVVHTLQDDEDMEFIRIISARRADKNERKIYEYG